MRTRRLAKVLTRTADAYEVEASRDRDVGFAHPSISPPVPSGPPEPTGLLTQRGMLTRERESWGENFGRFGAGERSRADCR